MTEEQAIDILKNSIADYVVGDYCEKCADNKICEDRNEDCYYIQAINKIVNLIQKQDTEINKLNNVIDRMVKHIVEQTYKDLEECEFEDKYNINCNSSKRTCEDCIKEYFMKE